MTLRRRFRVKITEIAVSEYLTRLWHSLKQGGRAGFSNAATGSAAKTTMSRSRSPRLDFVAPADCNDDVLMQDLSSKALKSLSEFVLSTAEKGTAGLSTEYRMLEDFHPADATHKAFANNLAKNRYSDVLCIDRTRVVLKFGGSKHGDYIHANHVQDASLLNNFICTQGPLQQTVHDFWRMVFQERAGTILMLCKPSEDFKQKCHVYWPESEEEPLDTPTLVVRNLGAVEGSEFHSTTFRVEPKQEANGLKPLTVTLHRWSTWPDRGIPDHSCCMMPIRLLRTVRESRAPCVVHCSAGIGRTGTVVGIEIAMRRIANGLALDIPAIVRELRSQRALCIQTEVQYLYVNRVLVEWALSLPKLDAEVADAAKKFIEDYDARLSR
uniref:Protein-tyrosine phosphatase n=1 Tax=Steinernema glaseri TaxID=37863 RepID=A0A1I8ACJ7_9BILA